MAPITIGEKTFDTKTAAMRYTADMLKRGTLPSPAFMQGLLSRHPEKAYKLPDIERFGIQKNTRFKHNEFMYYLDDGTTDTFSYRYCFGDPGTDFTTRALRRAIASQIIDFKNAKGSEEPGYQCAQCSCITDTVEVDHVNPFAGIAKAFTVGNPYTGTFRWDPRSKLCYFGNADYEKRWQAYHAEQARLQLLCKECHLSKTKLGSAPGK